MKPELMASLDRANQQDDLWCHADIFFEALTNVDTGMCSVVVRDYLGQAHAHPVYLRWKLFSERMQASSQFTVPLQFILQSSKRRLQGRYLVYAHYFRINGGPLKAYVGVTRRHWAERWFEHSRTAMQGGGYLLHRILRQFDGQISDMTHEIIRVGLSLNEAYELEEQLIERCSLAPKGYNMIPGGYAGHRTLAENGMLASGQRRHVDRERALLAFADRVSNRYGVANPLIAAYWDDPDYAARVICGAPGRLRPDQVHAIRAHGLAGLGAEQIRDRVAAHSDAQVSRVLSGKSYRRI
jgi:hypothetical protein